MWTKAALDHLETIPHKQRAQIIKKARALQLNPHPQGSKKLRVIVTSEGAAVYRERSGDYRILYEVQTKPHMVVVILDVDDRKDVYK